MTRTLFASLAFAACLVPAWPAVAQNGLGSIVDSVARLDRNFDVADRNRDGLLSREEAKAGPVPFIAAHFDVIDTARRGQVSKDDVHTYIGRMLLRSRPAAGSSAAGR